MAATGGYDGVWMRRARQTDEWLAGHKVVVSATTASIISTFAGFPLDSLKSRLQSSRENIPMARLAADVVREEGIGGLWRGFPLPLITISIVRTISFTIYTSTKRILNSTADSPPPVTKPWIDLHLGILNKNRTFDVAMTSLIAGGASGAVVCIGSAPFELVKVRRQLEYQIYRDSHPELFAPTQKPHVPQAPKVVPLLHAGPVEVVADAIENSVASNKARPSGSPQFVAPTTMQAVRMIVRSLGPMGLWNGFPLHFVRDTLGTALYFAEYDVMRFWLSGARGSGKREDKFGSTTTQADLPAWARGWLPAQFVPFLCGSLAGVTSWALIYPVDAIKTKAQQRAMSGLAPRTPYTQLRRLVRGTDGTKPWLSGIARLYRGLGVSMVRSMLTHGLLWTLVDWTSGYIDGRPVERFVERLA
ncbi:hypothetical protein CcaverHIS002_0502980 [Cutaneotrichosporon cavernicola]|uniref:Mitochondrial carrier n=1 Tax=Cutaneotrichosporon cavernicola TaxID=279322 RepID=A0AA48L692_9TREE|nr:uncharacterized protein CcaverHIS019_0503550 [Cutaneotrichosporon cavernicola]BEI84897.1 hypothetical protein CcaverHIS002_0502980 [Cutaneotrichosporon cavernicola]BEI92727.1 hypothetical protein CcaverHIS019_0503550 [Cutaneotrichosporon cavernicola]BEJ00504.1 hypothetical protein CcaverHIS631_0503610 [Cutaneotrichosporon cavernicola]BEJ08273.1 hypothetical protein CcaverHIS641_0503580 [Cutaneotrichosporon cavernicola]